MPEPRQSLRNSLIEAVPGMARPIQAGAKPLIDFRPSRKRSAQETENDITYAPSGRPKQAGPSSGKELLVNGTLFIVFGILSPQLKFCWWLMLMSIAATYYYAKFVMESFQPPQNRLISYHMAKFVVKSSAKVALLAGMSYWCLSITPFHIFAPTAMDIWTPYAVHEALRMTEVVYDPGNGTSIDIFAIHGLGSRPESAWTYNSNETKVSWLSELLPQARGFQDARIVMVNHQTRWDSNAAYMELDDHASSLLENIEGHHKANPDRPIIFIAHSFGGLLLKKALLLAKSRSRDVAAMTRGIIFLGVPHRGTYAALVASCLSCTAFFRGSSSSLHEFMSVDGPQILDLESNFYDAYVIPHHPYQPQLYVCDVLEMRPERIGKLVLGSIVRPKHGLLRHGRVFTLDADHRGLNKFRSHDDPNFLMLLRILLQAKTFALQPDPFRDLSVPKPHPPQNETLITPPDLLEFISYGMPWNTSNRLVAFLLGGLQEFVASILAFDRNRHNSYLTGRIPKLAFYECVVGVSIGQILGWLVFKQFEACTSLEARILQIIISNITIVPILRATSLAASAFIAGASELPHFVATIKVGLAPSLKCSWTLSLICIVAAHALLTPQTWAPFFHAVSFFLNTCTNIYVKEKRLRALRKLHHGYSGARPTIGNGVVVVWERFFANSKARSATGQPEADSARLDRIDEESSEWTHGEEEWSEDMTDESGVDEDKARKEKSSDCMINDGGNVEEGMSGEENEEEEAEDRGSVDDN